MSVPHRCLRGFVAVAGIAFLIHSVSVAFDDGPSLGGSASDETGSNAAQDADPPAAILPDRAPAALSGDEFADIAPRWDEWGEETSELISELYEEEADDARQRRDRF